MFNRETLLIIHGRTISDPLAIRLAQYMTEDRALFVAQLRGVKNCTWRTIAEDCGRAWSKDWGPRQDIGAALCNLASAYLGEDWNYLDSLDT